MLSSHVRPLFVRIGELELDERKRELRATSGRLAIQPKVFDVLVHLVRARDRVVSRDELLRAIWPATTVGPDSITRAIREVRRLLGANQEMVRTYPSRGVRFVGQVLDLDPPTAIAPGLFGFDELLASLEVVLARTTLTGGGIRIVIGAPGTGKSAMLNAVARRAHAAGVAVVRAPTAVALDRTVAEVAARQQPSLVIHDDLLRSIDALDVDAKRLAATVASAPVVVVAACCSSSRRDPRVAAVLAAATRTDPDAVVTLDSLDRRALAGLAAHVLGRTVSPAALSKLESLTGGNPRFARHILHLAKSADRPLETLDKLPPSFADRLRELVLEHVGVVGAETRAVLDAISIVDPPFTLDVAAEIAGTGSDRVADSLAEAAAVGLVVESPAARWRFAHELVRSVVERALAPSRRAAYHARAAVALERWLGTPPSQLDRVARHYAAGAAAASLPHVPRALEVVRMSAARALERLAFDAAARWAATALDIEALLIPPSPPRRRQLWLELAMALVRDGQVERAAEAFAAASADPDLVPRGGDAGRVAFLSIAPELPRIVDRFYELLFERHPQVRPMFNRSAPLQRRMFGETIARLVEHVDDAEWLRAHLEELGRRHVEYGVTEEMYGWARAAFLDAIAEAFAPRRLPNAVRSTWERAFDSISAAMLASDLGPRESRTVARPRASAR